MIVDRALCDSIAFMSYSNPFLPAIPADAFEVRIKELCQQIVNRQSEPEAVELSRQLQILMHKRVEDLRENVLAVPVLNSE